LLKFNLYGLGSS